jgi:hypothetical protein
VKGEVEMAVNSLSEKKKELLVNAFTDTIREILTQNDEENMPGNVIGGVVAAVVEEDGAKRVKAIGNFDGDDFFLDGMDMIRNSYYKPIARKLVEIYPEIKNLPVDRILFIDVADEKPKRRNARPIFVKYAKAPKYMPELMGFDYVIKFFKANMQDRDTSFEQMVILLYEQLRLIQAKEYDLIGFGNVYATFGKDWQDTVSQLPNLIDAKIEWQNMKGSQVSIYDDDSTLRVVK